MSLILRYKQQSYTTRIIIAMKFYLFFYCLINLLSTSKSESCNHFEECQELSKCAYYSQMNNIQNLRFCDAATGIVCCPKIKISTATVPQRIDKRPFERACTKWQQTIYPKCPSPLISGGEDAKPKEFPHMALVGTYLDFKYNWFCGGSLISSKYVLTAAHCIESEGGVKPNRIRLGELDYKTTADDDNTQEFTIKNFKVYPKYRSPLDYYDIALVELIGEAIFNEYVAPICLPSSNANENSSLLAAGWGFKHFAGAKATHLQKVKLDRFDNKQCKRSAGKDLVTLPHGINTTSQFCFGSTFDNRNTCQADSGGPLFIEHTDRLCMYEILGITSFGASCGTPNSPGVYTRIIPYIDWIEENIFNEENVENVKL